MLRQEEGVGVMRHTSDIAVFSQMPKPLEPAGDSFYRPSDRRGSARVIFIDTGRKSEGTWAVSSAVEHYVDIVVATGSIPVPPTILTVSCKGNIKDFKALRAANGRRTMKVANSLRSLKTRHRDCQVVRRKGRVYVINKTQKRYKARQG